MTRLKALVAIPKVQPRFAIAIWKKYPTMKSLLSVYMDPTKSVCVVRLHLFALTFLTLFTIKLDTKNAVCLATLVAYR